MKKSILLIAGIIILLISLIADTLGVGREPGFGYLQISGTIIGAVVIVLGLIRLRKK